MGFNSGFKGLTFIQFCVLNGLTPILLTWRIWWASNNATKWQRGFNSAFKGLINKLNEFDYSRYDNWTQFSFSHGSTALNWPRPPQSRGFTITLRHTILGRTPLDEGSARRRELYLTIHNTHNRQPSTHPVGFEPAIPTSQRLESHALDHAVTGTGN